MNRYTNSPVANWQGQLYNLPFNMNTFYQMWGVTTPAEAETRIAEQRAEAIRQMKAEGVEQPRNLEEQALALIGRDIYERLIKGYTENNGGDRVPNCRPSSSDGFPYALSLTIITSTTAIKAFP